MNNNDFKYHQRTLNLNIVDQFNGTVSEKNLLFSILCEWNENQSVSVLSRSWRKERPKSISEFFFVLLWNCEGLRTHISDLDLLLSLYCPHMCILTGVGSLIHNLPNIPQYKWFSKEGSNSFGGVAILVHNHFSTTLIDESENFLLIQTTLMNEKIYIGAVYIPPKCILPFDVFDRHKEKEIFIFGDFNAKHKNWECEKSNVSRNKLYEWLNENGFEVMHCSKPTSKKSDSIIDFGIGKDIKQWKIDRLEEGTSDHYPMLFFSPFISNEKGVFKKTNGNLFNFFLQAVYPYWNCLVYNYEYNFFFDLLSEFLAALHDRCSEYLSIQKFRPPWLPHLVNLAKTVNKARRKFRKTRFLGDYHNFTKMRKIYITEKIKYQHVSRERKIISMRKGNNIWTHVKNTFRPYSPSFKGLSTNGKICRDNQEIVCTLANYYEKHYSEPVYSRNNPFHIECALAYERIEKLPNIPLEKITLGEIEKQWKKLRPKKLSDSTDTSAFLLKNLPYEYLHIITILFNPLPTKPYRAKRKNSFLVWIK